MRETKRSRLFERRTPMKNHEKDITNRYNTYATLMLLQPDELAPVTKAPLPNEEAIKESKERVDANEK